MSTLRIFISIHPSLPFLWSLNSKLFFMKGWSKEGKWKILLNHELWDNQGGHCRRGEETETERVEESWKKNNANHQVIGQTKGTHDVERRQKKVETLLHDHNNFFKKLFHPRFHPCLVHRVDVYHNFPSPQPTVEHLMKLVEVSHCLRHFAFFVQW